MEPTMAPRKENLQERISSIFKRITNIEKAFHILREDVKSLKWVLKSKNYNSASFAELMGKEIEVFTVGVMTYYGILTWVDKYEIGMRCKDEKEIIINKGSIISIQATKM